MKLVRKSLEKDSSGSIALIAQEPEDMWHTYNLLSKGDHLQCSTVRKVTSETSTGSTDKQSMRLNLTIDIHSIFFDVQVCVLRVNGRNIQENKHVKMGAYHTLDLELNRPFTITKPLWDFISIQRIHEACDITKRADIAAIMMQEGLANICLVTSSMTIVRQKIEISIPKKRRGTSTDHDKGLKKFYHQTMQAILTNIDFNIVKVLIIASPGFTKDDFYKYLTDNYSTPEFKIIQENRSKIMLVHSSSGQKHSLGEILDDPSVQSQLVDTKYSKEIKTLQSFYKILANEPSKAFYGYKYVMKAVERGAVDTLMVTDSLFRAADVTVRKQYIKMVETVKDTGGKIMIFSSLHTSGEQLENLTGVAAILHFPMPDLEEEVDDNQ